MKRGGFVYILTNKNKTVLYTGVTSDLKNRIWEHINKKYSDSFTAKYNLKVLVYFETFSTIEEAIHREKQIKAGSRKNKEALINSNNPGWNNLIDELENW